MFSLYLYYRACRLPTAPQDYTAIITETVKFHPDDPLVQSVHVSTASDSTFEGTETFSAQLSNPDPADRVIIQDPDATINILETDRELV